MTQKFLNARLIFSFLAIGALLLLVAGCGDEGEASPLPKKDFIEQADEICKEATAELQAAGEKYGRERASAKSPQESKELLETQLDAFVNDDIAPSVEGVIDEIESLGIPSGDEKEVTAILDELQSGIDEAKKDPQKFFLGNKSLLEAAELGSAYGFETCGRLVSE